MGKTIVQALLHLFQAEDSSSWEGRSTPAGSSRNSHSIAKCLTWYIVSLGAAILLAQLH